MTINSLLSASHLSDTELLAQLFALAASEREATARLIALLAELDARRLYLEQGCSSLFTYCTQVLHLSESAAYGRIEAARAARKFPVLLEQLADGSLHLTAVCLLGPHLTEENHIAVLAAAHHKSKREVEQLVAALRPQPAVPALVRKLPTPSPRSVSAVFISAAESTESAKRGGSLSDAAQASAPVAPRAQAKPLAPALYKVQFTASQETYNKLRLAQDLLRHRIPNGDIAAVVDRALTLLVQELHKVKHAEVRKPRPQKSEARGSRNRHVPAAVKRAVWQRDSGQCAFVGPAGRCTERGFLEYHHRVPLADAGAMTIDNLELRCRAHNAYEAELWFGADVVREIVAAYG